MLADISLVISSCDSFAACWPPFMHGLDKYWPEGPANAIIITNQRTLSHRQVKTFPTGQDYGWAKNLRLALASTPDQFILYMQEDYWLDQPVDTRLIDSYLSHFREGRLDYLRLAPVPPGDNRCAFDGRLDVLRTDARYRTSLQPAIWRKAVLISLLVDDETPWDFELVGNARSAIFAQRFACVHGKGLASMAVGNLSYVCTAINKGRWSTDAVRYAKRENLVVEFNGRPRETWWDDFLRHTFLGRQLRIFGRLCRWITRKRSRSRSCNG